MEEYGLLVFYSTHYAMEAEKYIKEADLPARIISTPERIKASCGFSLKYDIQAEESILKILNEHHLLHDSYYHAKGKGLNITYRKVDQ